MSSLPDREPVSTDLRDGPVERVITSRMRDIGAITVRRLLPAPERRLVGPFIFFDHMGPAELEPGAGIDVRPHPHIALATVTYLFEGELLHRDSLGSEQRIVPGDVNWMIAGRGIVHSERTGPERRRAGGRVNGIQSWVALPLGEEDVAPAFSHHPGATLPVVRRDGATLVVIAGEAFGATAPTEVLSPTLYVDAQLEAGADLELPVEHVERAVYVVDGEVRCAGRVIDAGTMAVLRPGERASLHAENAARAMLLGGAPLEGERYIWWNFVASSKERIDDAKRAWKEGRFPKVPGDEVEFIPLPEG